VVCHLENKLLTVPLCMDRRLALLGLHLSLTCATIKAVSYQVVLMLVRPELPEHYRTVLLALLDNHLSVVCHLESKLPPAYLCGITSGIFGSCLACTTIKALSYQVVLLPVRPVFPEHYSVLLAFLYKCWAVVFTVSYFAAQ
jgi:hypothetical protein